MPALAGKLTLAEFQSKYQHSDCSYEYWYGEILAKAMPTWVHGLLQGILIRLLTEAGYRAGSEVELRIDPEARLKPDIIATSGEVEEPYPTKAVDVVVEILSPDDAMSFVLKKCQAYETWGFEYIYIVDAESNQLFRWTGSELRAAEMLTTVSAKRIWKELESNLRRRN